MVTSHFITHTQDYHTHVYSKNINFSPTLFSSNLQPEHKSFPRTGPQDLLVTHYDCEENEQKTLHKYATMRNRTTSYRNYKCNSDTLIKSPSSNSYKFTATFSEKKVHCSQVSNGNKNRLDHESFYQSNIERLLHLNPEDCKNELLRLNITRNKNTDRKLVYFQVFSDSVHQAELERYQGHKKLAEKYPYNGAHGRLTYDINDKHWIPHIGINNPSNCKADTKNKGYQEIMFFDWKIQLEKIQPTRIHTIASYKIILTCTLHQDNHTTVFSLLTLNTLHHFFLTSHIASKILTFTVFFAIMIP